jgi:catechol-2,3-dioxygenase
MMKPRKRIGELVLRSENAEALVKFYRDVIGLEPYASIGSATFLKVDDDLEGHPQLLAIFQESHTFSGPKDVKTDLANSRVGTLHHFAFVVDQQDFESEKDRLLARNLSLQFAEFSQFGWRSIYLFDPDGNSVEFVCYDSSLLDLVANQQVRHFN